jgi:hypothetical protein
LLTATPFELLSEEGRSLSLRRMTEYAAYVEGLKAELTALIAGPVPASLHEARDDFSAHEIAVATKSSVYAADRQIALARDLVSVLRATGAAMRAGDVTAAQALALHDTTGQLPVEVARAIEARVLRRAAIQSLRNFKASLARAAAALDPDFVKRSKEARAEVEVTHTAFGDGVGQLYVRGPLEITTAIHMALTAYAAKTKDSLGGTVDQRKLAAVRDWAEIDLASADTPSHHRRLPTVNVVIDLATLFGLRNHPAEIPGVGPLPADAARWLLADGAPLRRLIIDPLTGHLLDYDTSTYTVPPDLADYLIAKNVTSAAPHSTVDSRLADMEHNIPHDQRGPTDPINVTPVDRRWHRSKTHGRWRYRKREDGAVIWTSPTGLTCQVDPYDYRTAPVGSS